jgi:hypothetical protein
MNFRLWKIESRSNGSLNGGLEGNQWTSVKEGDQTDFAFSISLNDLIVMITRKNEKRAVRYILDQPSVFAMMCVILGAFFQSRETGH